MLGLFPLAAVWRSRELWGLERKLESHGGGWGGGEDKGDIGRPSRKPGGGVRTGDVNRLEGGQERQCSRHPPTPNSALTSFHSPFHQLVPAACFLGTRRQNLQHEHEKF